MKFKLITMFMSAVVLFGSCIKDEAQNMEADILECVLPDSILRIEPIVNNSEVLILILKGKVDKTSIAPKFALTPGATISPASGTPLDFTHSQTYTVTSEDGKWSKTYKVTISDMDVPTKYNFNNWEQFTSADGKTVYEQAYEEIRLIDNSVEHLNIWASGNPGIALTYAEALKKDPQAYPTLSTTDAREGRAAKLTTCKAGAAGQLFGKPLAAGNLFIGSFKMTSLLGNPLTATKFGLPIDKAPAKFSGYYKYKAGDEYLGAPYKVSGKWYQDEQPGEIDSCRIYAVFYENDNGTFQLDGTNVLTHPNLVATAIVKNPTQTLDANGDLASAYKYFEADFTYHKPIDNTKLGQSKYSMAVIFSSSYKGDFYMGAVGSTLYIDDVEVTLQ